MSCNVASLYLRRAALLDSACWGKCSIASSRHGGDMGGSCFAVMVGGACGCIA
ncbi:MULTISPECIES: hypothetical protein [unclassified Bartonella]|uniref:hypothetical protein n=1 Tax=unclassified Bartonella TaxID=2645622 RepID=UPI0035D0E3DA